MQFIPLKTKNSYHTALVFKAQMNLLSPLEKSYIPKSTLHDWRRRDLSRIVGANSEDPIFKNLDLIENARNSKNFQNAFAALLKVFYFYLSLVQNIRGKRKIWNHRKKQIVSIIQRIAPPFGLKRACRFMKVSIQRFYRWKNEILCDSSAFGLCRKMHPKQLTIEEQKVISKYLKKTEFFHWPLRSIFYKILNDGAAFFSLATFYKYASVLGPARQIIRKARRKIGIRSNAPLKLLHMDTTILQVQDGSKVYIHFIIDNFSRTILGWKASLEWNSKLTLSNLCEVCERFNLFHEPFTLLCDDGSENSGEVDVFLNGSGRLIKKLIAQVDIHFSNSMVEAVNKIMKYRFLFPKNLVSFQDVIHTLKTAVPEYNSRPSGVLFGYSPNQVLDGAIPDKHRFGENIKEAASKRPELNKTEACEAC